MPMADAASCPYTANERYSVRKLYFPQSCYSKRQKYLPFTIAASGGCEWARMEISRFAARARRGVNVQNEIRFDVYDI